MFKPIVIEKTFDYTEKILEKVWAFNPRYQDDANNYFETGHVDGTFFIGGKNGVFLNEIKNIVKSAREMVCICSFLIASEDFLNIILEAVVSGIRVYIITAIDDQLSRLPDDGDEFTRKKYEGALDLSQKLKDVVLLRSASHIHSKFIITDPRDNSNSKAIILTPNLTKEAFEHAEIGIKISDPVVIEELYYHFCNGFWYECERELQETGYRPVSAFKNPYHHINSVLITSKEQKTLKNAILNLIDNADNEIVLATYGIQDDTDIFKALLRAVDKGNKLTLITRLRGKIMAAVIELGKKGARVVADNSLHAKFILCTVKGLKTGIVMTANIEKTGIDTGYETGYALDENDAARLEIIARQWIDNFPWQFKYKTTLKQVSKKILIIDQSSLKFTEIPVEDIQAIDNDVYSKNFDEMTNYTIEAPKQDTSKFVKKIKRKVTVHPPALPKDAVLFDVEKEIEKISNQAKNQKRPVNIPAEFNAMRNVRLKIYRSNKKYYVLVDDAKRAKDAWELAESIGAVVVVEEQ